MPRVLVVDDDQDVREMLRQMLERAGYGVSIATNGKEALTEYRAAPADLMVTDIVMPEKEGLETILDLRKDFPDVKIIAISGGGRLGPQNYIEMASAFGAKRTFTKPLDRKEFLAAVSDLIGPA